jgi:hypothetical protein
VLLALTAGGAWAGGEDMEARRRMFLDAVWTSFEKQGERLSARAAFWRAEALFERGNVDEARRLVHRGLDQLVPGNRENRWMHGGNTGFIAWPGIDCYIRYERHLDDTLKERYRKIYTGGVFYRRLSTSNHKIMAATTRYLATQVWGTNAFQADPFFGPEHAAGSYFQRNDPTGEKYLREIIEATVRGGPGEYASRPYGAENVLPLLTLAECARDGEMSRCAKLAYETALIQLAPAYLGGHLATFSPRSYPDTETQSPWGIAVIPWYYWGGVPPGSLDGQWALRAATSRYQPPDALRAAATDRSKPYEYRSLINRWALNHWVNRSYALFSRSPKAAGRGFQGQSYPCGVMWAEPNPARGSHLWVTNPAADNNAMKGNEASGLHTHGVSKYEQELLHRDALLYVFNIARDFRNPYVLGYVPGGYRAALGGEKQLFFHYGSVLVAVSATHPIQWDPKSGIRAPASKPRAGDSEFRIDALQCAVALETAHPDEFPGTNPEEQLAAFRARVRERTRIGCVPGERPAGSYRDRAGNELEVVFDGEDRLNGAPMDYARWPVLESPWTRQERPEGPLRLMDGGRVVAEYDFTTWTRSEIRAAER